MVMTGVLLIILSKETNQMLYTLTLSLKINADIYTTQYTAQYETGEVFKMKTKKKISCI